MSIPIVILLHIRYLQDSTPRPWLITQFGGGKTHTLAALYHLCSNGAKAKNFFGVAEMMRTAGVKVIPDTKVAVFVGNS